jgi:hypothetical protein
MRRAEERVHEDRVRKKRKIGALETGKLNRSVQYLFSGASQVKAWLAFFCISMNQQMAAGEIERNVRFPVFLPHHERRWGDGRILVHISGDKTTIEKPLPSEDFRKDH